MFICSFICNIHGNLCQGEASNKEKKDNYHNNLMCPNYFICKHLLTGLANKERALNRGWNIENGRLFVLHAIYHIL